MSTIQQVKEKNSKCEIWAVGGGKGGTGKSFISSSIGSSLASQGKKVVLIDADMGGANLHSFVGIKRPSCSLTEFFEKKIPLSELVIQTGLPNLALITGDIDSPDSNNVKHTQKLKLFRHLRNIDADYVIIDLGAGSHTDTLDTFLLSDKMIIVTAPEVTAMENMYHFMKNMIFRKLKKAFNANGLRDVVQETWKNREVYGFKNIKDLIAYLSGISLEIKEIVDAELNDITIYLAMNQVRGNQDIPIGLSVKSVFYKYLGFESKYVGYVGYDDCVRNCTRIREPFMQAYPSSNCAVEIRRLTDNLIAGRQIKIFNY